MKQFSQSVPNLQLSTLSTGFRGYSTRSVQRRNVARAPLSFPFSPCDPLFPFLSPLPSRCKGGASGASLTLRIEVASRRFILYRRSAYAHRGDKGKKGLLRPLSSLAPTLRRGSSACYPRLASPSLSAGFCDGRGLCGGLAA